MVYSSSPCGVSASWMLSILGNFFCGSFRPSDSSVESRCASSPYRCRVTSLRIFSSVSVFLAWGRVRGGMFSGGVRSDYTIVAKSIQQRL